MRHFHLRPGCIGLLLVGAVCALHGQDKAPTPWQGAAFSASPREVSNAAAKIKADRYSSATILSDEIFISVDAANRVIHRQHFVYRVDSSDAMRWAGTVEALYSPWRQKKPDIRARVITADGRVSTLNASVLTEAPAHDQRPDIRWAARCSPASGPEATIRTQPGCEWLPCRCWWDLRRSGSTLLS